MKTDLLELDSYSLLLFKRRKYSNIVVGVPHHAPVGVKKLPCPEHEDADENAGFIGQYVAEALELCSVIACNYPIDVNKSMSSDYATIIAGLKAKYLIEIHGHGNKLAKFNVEISSGKKDRTISADFANAILEKSSRIDDLKNISVSGDFQKIHFKATNSETITTDSWIPFHIELPPELRIPTRAGSIRPPAVAYYFADCVVNAIKKICI